MGSLCRCVAVFLLVSSAPAPEACAAVDDPCPTCGGTGSITCPVCKGTGVAEWTAVHGQPAAYGCENCGGVRGDPMQGTGSQGRGFVTCPTCRGTGQTASHTPPGSVAPKGNADVEKRKAEDAQQRREEFQEAKEDALRSLKGVPEERERLKGVGESSGLGVKGVGETDMSGHETARGSGPDSPARNDQMTNPQIARLMQGLRNIHVPPPLSRKEASLSWKSIALSGESRDAVLEEVGDIGLLAWDLGGRIGSTALFEGKVLLVTGKVFIAGEEGAYVHLVKQDKVYEEALRYLKNPGTAKQFARLVRDVKEKKPLPASTESSMLRAARAILDPKLGSSGMRIAWDAMLSPEARAAMARKACLEIGTELVGSGTEGLVRELTRRKGLYDAVRRERKEALRMLNGATTSSQKEELRMVITKANSLLEATYRLERLGSAGMGELESIYVAGDIDAPTGRKK